MPRHETADRFEREAAIDTVIQPDPRYRIARELIQLLHQEAAADVFAQWLAEVQGLPETLQGKSTLVDSVHMAMAVRNRLELQHERERGMMAVLESAQELSSRLDMRGLFSTIVSRARNLLGSDLGWLSVHDAESGDFHVLVAEGALSRSTSTMVTSHDRGVASVVMSSRLPFATPDYLHDNRFLHDPALDDAFRAEGIAALVGVPMIWNGEVTGLLFMADRYQRVHSAQNVSILCALATHGAVALKNARDFQRANEALDKARQAQSELERHVRNIQAAADAHERMTSLLARGASLATLCESVAHLLDGSLLVLDEAAQVVSQGTAAGYSGAGAQSYVPHGQHNADLAQALRLSRQTGRSVLAYKVDGESCRVMPVIGGDDVLGSVALFHRGELEELAIRTFERSSSVIGIVLLSQERTEATKSRDASTLLRSLVSPRQDEPGLLANRAERHGLDLVQPLSLLLLETNGPSTGYAARWLRNLAALSNALVEDIDGTLVVLCAATKALEVRQAVLGWARHEANAACRGVMSRPVSGSAEVPALYATLKRALPVLGRLGINSHVVAQNELALYSALFETHDQASLANFLDATLGPLITQDSKRLAELAFTLLTYFDSGQNAKTTAQRLQIHVNTIRQRLATIEDLIGHWGNASRALELHIALRLWHLSDPRA